MKQLRSISGLLLAIAVLTSTGCRSAADHAAALHSADERSLTVGVVQREIRRGMSGSDVAQALGSPNIVTRDSTGNETWVYDKIATEASVSRDSGSIFLILGGYQKSAGATAQTQRTLTVVINFDKDSRVSAFTYHASKF